MRRKRRRQDRQRYQQVGQITQLPTRMLSQLIESTYTFFGNQGAVPILFKGAALCFDLISLSAGTRSSVM